MRFSAKERTSQKERLSAFHDPTQLSPGNGAAIEPVKEEEEQADFNLFDDAQKNSTEEEQKQQSQVSQLEDKEEKKKKRKSHKSHKSSGSRATSRFSRDKEMAEALEVKCMEIIEEENWDKLEDTALDELDISKGQCDRAYYYLGISLYKQEHFSHACIAFQKSVELKPDEA